jgi:hypothetical protein
MRLAITSQVLAVVRPPADVFVCVLDLCAFQIVQTVTVIFTNKQHVGLPVCCVCFH